MGFDGAVGRSAPGGVREHIASSWRRARLAGIDPDGVDRPEIAEVDRVGRLAVAAEPVLRALAAEAASTEALADEARALAARADASADYAEGRAAFSEKRPPRFTGT